MLKRLIETLREDNMRCTVELGVVSFRFGVHSSCCNDPDVLKMGSPRCHRLRTFSSSVVWIDLRGFGCYNTEGEEKRRSSLRIMRSMTIYRGVFTSTNMEFLLDVNMV